jgi:phosphatidylglycerol:prolipoprotein diacylglycerol transferase
MYESQLGFALTALAYVVGSLVFFLFSRGRGFSRKQTLTLLFAALCGGIFGAKCMRLTFAVASGADPLMVLAHPDGRTILGGVLFGWLAVEFAKKRMQIERSTGDAFALALAAGESIGRIGCYFNQCCYGAIAALPWAVYQGGAWRHPTQLYSSALSLTAFVVLLCLRNRFKYEGDLFRFYFLYFGVSRFLLEFLRERTDVHFGLSIAQWVSLEISAAMLVGIIVMRRKQRQAEEALATSGI